MKKHKVIITDSALNDMEAIYNHIAYVLCAPIAARNQYKKLADKIMSLEVFPERQPILDFSEENEVEFRRLLVKNYSILYVIQDDKVIVTNVLYTPSDIAEKIKKIKINL